MQCLATKPARAQFHLKFNYLIMQSDLLRQNLVVPRHRSCTLGTVPSYFWSEHLFCINITTQIIAISWPRNKMDALFP